MPQSLSNVNLHLVFSTKHRQNLIFPEIESDLYGYLGSTINGLGCKTIKVGGYLNHVHCLFKMSRIVSIAKTVEQLKKNSSKWIKTQGSQFNNFYWQDGYGIFSVNPKEIANVVKYIEQQKEHHSRKSFEKEYIEFLIENDIAFDEKYVWD